MKDFLDRLKIGQKLYFLFLTGVLIPMVLTDAIIFYSVYKASRTDMENTQEKVASSVEYTLKNRLVYPIAITGNIYQSDVMENFMNEQYTSPADYYTAYYRMRKELLFGGTMGIEDAKIYIFADNPTITNGGGFYRMDKAKESDWYHALEASRADRTLLFYYGTITKSERIPRRKVLLLVKYKSRTRKSCDKLVMVEMGYDGFEQDLLSLDLDCDVYVCDKDTVLLSNRPDYRVQDPYVPMQLKSSEVYTRQLVLYNRTLTIHVVPRKSSILSYVGRNGGILFLLMVINIVLPLLMFNLLDRSVTGRILRLQKRLERADAGELEVITIVEGNDEITSLIRSYNRMAERMNELVSTVYKSRLREQETNISRQNAELLALHSQINPHFLFNALESIRMHALVRNETETAEMVGKLAVMERTYVNWGEDLIPVQREMEFADAYLQLQKYRFGDRLNYEFSVADDSRRFAIPKLTIVTFVENACVHGVESKSTPGWIFVRVYKEDGWLKIEVEDTGAGIDEEEAAQISERVNNVTIESMKDKKHVGMMNAYLRVRRQCRGRSLFVMESEKGVGTTVRIQIPLGVM